MWQRLQHQRRWPIISRQIRIALLVVSVLLFTVGLVYLFRFLEVYLKASLEGFALAAYFAVFILSLLSSATVVFPVPAWAVVLAAAMQWNPFWVAFVSGTGAALGEITGYYVGYLGRKAMDEITSEAFVMGYSRVEAWVRRFGSPAVFFLSLIPFLPFDFIGIAAGALRLPFRYFFLACWGGKLARFFLLIYLGAEILRFFI